MANSPGECDRRDVLVVPAHTLDDCFSDPQFLCGEQAKSQILTAIENHGAFVNREIAEGNPGLKQIVAYGLVRSEDRILCIRRSRNADRPTLRLKYTVLFGGHVDSLEQGVSRPLESCLRRELSEELGLTIAGPYDLLGAAVDPTTFVGSLHLGLIFDVPAPSSEIVLDCNLDTQEFVGANRRTIYSLVPAREVVNERLDAWSSLLLESEISLALLGVRRQTSARQFSFSWRIAE